MCIIFLQVEHSHSAWKRKLRDDILKAATDKQGRKIPGFHWTEMLPQYARLYNEGAHSALGRHNGRILEREINSFHSYSRN